MYFTLFGHETTLKSNFGNRITTLVCIDTRQIRHIRHGGCRVKISFFRNDQYATISAMAKVTKTDAAKLIGVVRQTIYDYIKQGRISADPDGLIDTSELIRAGFTLRLPDSQQDVGNGHDPTADTTASDTHQAPQNLVPISKVIELYEQRIDTLERELADAKKREEDTARREQRLLTMLEQEQKQRQFYLPASASERPMGGFLARIFSRKGSQRT